MFKTSPLAHLESTFKKYNFEGKTMSQAHKCCLGVGKSKLAINTLKTAMAKLGDKDPQNWVDTSRPAYQSLKKTAQLIDWYRTGGSPMDENTHKDPKNGWKITMANLQGGRKKRRRSRRKSRRGNKSRKSRRKRRKSRKKRKRRTRRRRRR